MNNLLKYNRLLAYSEKNNQYADIKFENGINIIYGRNTSGKSTLIQLILYTFGINDVKNLYELSKNKTIDIIILKAIPSNNSLGISSKVFATIFILV